MVSGFLLCAIPVCSCFSAPRSQEEMKSRGAFSDIVLLRIKAKYCGT